MSEWISVNDKLPEELHAVIVCDAYNCGLICIAAIDGGYFVQDSTVAEAYGGEPLAKLDDFAVTHWMPLPEPPK